jgi:hypothetical protein
MKTVEPCEVPAPERALLTKLRAADELATAAPGLDPDDAARARAWLTRVLADSRLLSAHLAFLQQLYGATFHAPLPRLCRVDPELATHTEPAPGFRHNQPLPAQRAGVVAEQGPSVLSDSDVSAVLLNPLALTDLADLIGYLVPAYWLPRLDEVGRDLMEATRNGASARVRGEGPCA